MSLSVWDWICIVFLIEWWFELKNLKSVSKFRTSLNQTFGMYSNCNPASNCQFGYGLCSETEAALNGAKVGFCASRIEMYMLYGISAHIRVLSSIYGKPSWISKPERGRTQKVIMFERWTLAILSCVLRSMLARFCPCLCWDFAA